MTQATWLPMRRMRSKGNFLKIHGKQARFSSNAQYFFLGPKKTMFLLLCVRRASLLFRKNS